MSPKVNFLALVAIGAVGLSSYADYNPTVQQLDAIVSEAKSWKGTPYKHGGKDKKGVDCSWFVHAAYAKVLTGYEYRMATAYLTDPLFRDAAVPKAGSLIVFPQHGKDDAHVGIIVDPVGKKFVGSQSSTGVAEASYGPTSYWGKRSFKIKELK